MTFKVGEKTLFLNQNMSLNIDSKIYTKHGLQFNCLTYVLLTIKHFNLNKNIYFVSLSEICRYFSWWLRRKTGSHHFRRMIGFRTYVNLNPTQDMYKVA